jgi:hypothetical protein
LAIEAFAQDWGTNAGSWIIIDGSDGVIDSAGEGELNVAGVPIPDTIPDTTTVLAVYNLGPVSIQGNAAVNAGDTIWYFYQLHNQGNGTDSLVIAADTVAGALSNFGEVLVAKDMNADSLWDGAVDSLILSNGAYGLSLAEDGLLNVLVGVVVPGAANDGDYSDVAITILGNNGSGTGGQ